MDEGEPISYLALATDTPVLSASGAEIGSVIHVLQIPELDEFDGIVVSTRAGHRFIDRDQIAEITTTCVRCDLSDEQAASLPAPNGPQFFIWTSPTTRDRRSMPDSPDCSNDHIGKNSNSRWLRPDAAFDDRPARSFPEGGW